MPHLKAIETIYHGYRFRSRLEARWAVFFDTLGVKYEYEKEGFDLGNAGWYLPDFWLPDLRYWVEIKGDKPTTDEMAKAARLSRDGNLVFLFPGPIQVPSSATEGPLALMFTVGREYSNAFGWGWQICPVCRTPSIEMPAITINDGATVWHCGECDYGEHRDKWQSIGEWAGYTFSKGDWVAPVPIAVERAPQLIAAYTAARQARFEHGETPTV